MTSLRIGSESVKNLELPESRPVSLKTTGQQLDIQLELSAGDAARFGIRVLKRGSQQTEIGYDIPSKSLYVDRNRSTRSDLHKAWRGRHAGPLSVENEGPIRMRVLVDAGSVEVFGGHGETVITDLVFPGPDCDQVELFAEGGSCRVLSCEVHKLKSVWHTR